MKEMNEDNFGDILNYFSHDHQPHMIDIIYKVEWLKDFDPVAIVQCASVHLEKVLGIYPNIDKLETGNQTL